MATLQIRKKSDKVWQHVDGQAYILTKFYAKTNGDEFKIVEDRGSNRKEYDYTDITVYDDTDVSAPETFGSALSLMLRLEVLKYVGFNRDGDVPPQTFEALTDTFTFAGESLKKVRVNAGETALETYIASDLTAATTPLVGDELVEVEQGGVTKKVPVSELGGTGGTNGIVPLFDRASNIKADNTTTGNVLRHEIVFPAGSLVNGDTIYFSGRMTKAVNTGSAIFRLYHSDDDFLTSTLIGLLTVAGFLYSPFERTVLISSAGNMRYPSTAASLNSDTIAGLAIFGSEVFDVGVENKFGLYLQSPIADELEILTFNTIVYR